MKDVSGLKRSIGLWLVAIAAGVVGGILGGLAVAGLERETLLLGVQTLLLAVLAAITAYYAKQTQLTVREMQAARRYQEETRRLEKSHLAASRALSILYHPVLDDWSSASDLNPATCQELARRLRNESPLVLDLEVRDRLRAAELCLFAAGFPEDEFKPGSQGYAVLVAKVVVRAARWTLEAFLREEGLPEWGELPSHVDAQAWLIDVVRGKRKPPK